MSFCLDLAGSTLKVGPKSIPFLKVGKEPWFRANDIAAALQLKHPANAINGHFDQKGRHAKYSKSLYELLADPAASPPNSRLDKNHLKQRMLSLDGMRVLICSCRTPAALQLAKEMGIDVSLKHSFHEQETIGAIQRAFKTEISIRQFPVSMDGQYSLDLFMPEHNIVVECDEKSHAHYDRDSEEERTQSIMEALDCPLFIRFNPDAKDFDIFSVIGDIHSAIRASIISKHQIGGKRKAME